MYILKGKVYRVKPLGYGTFVFRNEKGPRAVVTPEGCSCEGYRFRGSCKHVQALQTPETLNWRE